jgi:hypothetical protein
MDTGKGDGRCNIKWRCYFGMIDVIDVLDRACPDEEEVEMLG